MKTITWSEAVEILNGWASHKTDLHFAKTHGTHPEQQPFEVIHGECIHVISVSPDEGEIDLEVRESTVPVDLRGATIRHRDESVKPADDDRSDLRCRSLEFTFPEGDVWIFDEAPIDI